MDLAGVRRMITEKRYFVLHAPRQTGKTSALLALQNLLDAEGGHRCIYVNVEGAQAAREDVEEAMRTVLGELADRATHALGDESLEAIWPEMLATRGPHGALRQSLSRWVRAGGKPLVLLVDEIDALVGDSLLSVLRQLRAGYDMRPRAFPQSVILCGVRDVRDYRIHSGSLRLGDFSQQEVHALLGQHTEETGQAFTDGALAAVWRRTRGQPWLVNALAYETCFCGDDATDRSRPVASADVLAAQEALILRRETHLDQLADKLREGRVRRVVEPLLAGAGRTESSERDVEYVRDLGLVAQNGPLRIANPIYAEVVPRELTRMAQEEMAQDPAWYVTKAGGLQMAKLLEAFQEFFRQHSEHWVERFQYREAGPQLLLQAFLQRIVNSGGRIEREYGLGRGRTDLLVEWPEDDGVRRHVVECKVLHKGLEQTLAEGVEQTAAYMDRCGGETGHLVVFDRREGRSWDEKVFRLARKAQDGAKIEVWGM